MFDVDLEELLSTIDDLAACGSQLDDLVDRVSARVDALHLTWAGRAALAQQAAQTDWAAGFRAMREGLAAMRAAALVAHDHYDEAAGANLRMWEQVR